MFVFARITFQMNHFEMRIRHLGVSKYTSIGFKIGLWAQSTHNSVYTSYMDSIYLFGGEFPSGYF